jgi:3-isopropylmalate/(R)-2-methylmalate dehydratase small subunit
MEAFTTLTTTMAPLLRHDVDTDQIIPARYLRGTSRHGLGEGLFAGWRYTADGAPDPNFVLNQPAYAGAQILVAGDNFGCGSSREHAPWALLDYGFRVVVGISFADIFRNNAMKNGLLPVVVEPEIASRLARLAQEAPETAIAIDLAAQTVILPDGESTSFPIDSFNKRCLLEGLDQLGYLLRHEDAIATFERDRAG